MSILRLCQYLTVIDNHSCTRMLLYCFSSSTHGRFNYFILLEMSIITRSRTNGVNVWVAEKKWLKGQLLQGITTVVGKNSI